MTKKDITIINIAETVAPIISSRDIIERLKKLIKKAPTVNVVLDFSNVQFVSRSAAHQLLTIKEELVYMRLDKKVVSFINTNSDVTNMLRLVAANRAVPQKKKIKFDAKIINIRSLIIQN